MVEKWIRGSIKHKGRVHRDIMRMYGEKAFCCHGAHHCTIKPKYLDMAIAHAKKMHETSLEEALNEAKTLKRLHRHKERMAYA